MLQIVGRRVMHTAETQKKLQELQIAFKADCKVSKLGTSVGGPHFEGPIAGSSNASKRKEGSSDREKDGSTFGRFHTMGSEVTRHGQSDRDASSGSATLWPNSSGFKRPNSPGKHLHDPSKPAMSRESTVFPKHAAYGAAGSSGCKKRPGSSQELPNPKTDTGTEIKGSQDTIDSTNLLDRRLRKASTVKDPIYQTNKRLRSASEH
ncbi:hypothetical protein O6H91_13G059500 [Diphasiastrum complanatum]|uniref:Uncharacterized protein n=1 Tax=Diphasiastrum complanatum TaxID=34168 RepID=A0ACC2BV43_DIPCM|nr:hypothetical protein O6H91_13G059500 [Diphasiastrum complanatum]